MSTLLEKRGIIHAKIRQLQKFPHQTTHHFFGVTRLFSINHNWIKDTCMTQKTNI